MRTIAISFSLKDQNLQAILARLDEIKKREGDCILIHGNLPAREVKKRGLSTHLSESLEQLFPIQLNLWNNQVLRTEMGQYAKLLNAKVYVVGQVRGGVAEEVNIYKNYKLNIEYLPLN